MKLIKHLPKLLLVTLFILSSSLAFAFGETIESINKTNPSLGEEVIVTGTNLNDPNISAVIYPKDQNPLTKPEIIHYPTPKPGYPTAGEYRFTLGSGEGASLGAGNYRFSFIEDPSLSDAFIDFTISASGNQNGCSDTDPANAIDIKGLANYVTGDFTTTGADYCGEDGKTLYQAECAGSQIGYSSLVCDGSCLEGVCVSASQVNVPVCTVTDTKKDIYTLGIATYAKDKTQDYCGEDEKTVYQVECSGLTVMSYDQGTKCPGKCNGGVCERTNASQCSDEGSDIFSQESIKGVGGETELDLCDGDQLFQASCASDGTIKYDAPVICSEGCSNGACKKPSSSSITTCVDKDPKNDIYLMGKVSLGGVSMVDHCETNKLVQVQCSNSKFDVLKGVDCKYGCDNGACRVTPKATICEDKDPNNNPFEKGHLLLDGVKNSEDICDGEEVYQASCKGSEVVYSGYRCPAGCDKGACLALSFQGAPPKRVVPVNNLGNITPLPLIISDEDFNQQLNSTPLNQGDKLLNLIYQRGETEFKDVNPSAWYGGFVKRLYSDGLIKGSVIDNKPTGDFEPSKTLNTAEALTFVLRATNNQIALPAKDESWYVPVFNKAKALKITGQDFPSTKLVTRGETACMIVDALKLTKVDIPNQFKFADINSSHPQFRCLGALLSAGIMKGDASGTTLRPNGMVNRAEMAKMIDLTLDYRQPLCLDKKLDTNLRVYGFEARPLMKGGNIQLTKDGHYLVEVTAQIQNTSFGTTDLYGVPIRLYRHDLEFISGNLYREVIKEIKVPYSWESAYIQAGHIETLTAIVPVPNGPHFSESNGSDKYKYVDFTMAIDLPDNRIKESIDVTDNISSTRSLLVKDLGVTSAIKNVIQQRQIKTVSQPVQAALTSTTESDPNLANTASDSNTSSANTAVLFSLGGTTVSSSGSYRYDYLADSEYASYSTVGLNPHQKHKEVLATYFRSLAIPDLDGPTKRCTNIFPTRQSFSFTELGVESDGRLKVQLKGQVQKTGPISFLGNSYFNAIYMSEKGSNKPPQMIWFGGASLDDGKNNPVVENIDVTTLIKAPSTADVVLTLFADNENLIPETTEGDNQITIDVNIKSLAQAQANSCKLDRLNESDIWVMGSTYNSTGAKTAELEFQVQNKFGKQLTGVDFKLYQHENNAGQQKITEINAPASWSNVTLSKGRILTLTAPINFSTDLTKMIRQGDDLGYMYTIVADINNKIEEVDEVSNNHATQYLPMTKTLDQNIVSRDDLIALGGTAQEFTNSAYAFRNWNQYLTSRHRLPLVGKKYQDMHKLCTDLAIDGAVDIKQLPSSDAGKIRISTQLKIKKSGTNLPLPVDFALVELMHRADSSKPYDSIYKWNNWGFATDGADKDTLVRSLSAEIDFAPNGIYPGDFLFKINPESQVGEKTTTDNESRFQISTLTTSGKVDLAIADSDLKFDYIQSPKTSGTPSVVMSYVAHNLGSSDVVSPFKIQVRDKNTGKILATDNVPYIQKGAYAGSMTVNLDWHLFHEYEFEVVLDPDKTVSLDTNQVNNVTTVKWISKMLNNLGTSLSFGQTTDDITGVSIPLTHYFYNLDDTNTSAFYDNGQKFPLSPPLEKDLTRCKPHFSGTGCHSGLLDKTLKYVEDVFDNAVSLRGGVVTLSCEKCTNGVISLLDMVETKDAVRSIYYPMGDLSITNLRKASYLKSPDEPQYILGKGTDQVNYWRRSINGDTQDKDFSLVKIEQDLRIQPDAGKSEHLVYVYLSRDWITYLTTYLEPLSWWEALFPIFEVGRQVQDAYLDAWPGDDYQVFKVSVDNKKVTAIKEINSTEAFNLTKNNLGKYGSDFTQFLKFNYNGFPK